MDDGLARLEFRSVFGVCQAERVLLKWKEGQRTQQQQEALGKRHHLHLQHLQQPSTGILIGVLPGVDWPYWSGERKEIDCWG